MSGEVGADAEHDDRRFRAGGQRVQDPDEGASLVLVGAEGEQFLELVDEQHGPHRWRAAAVGARRSVVRSGTDGVQQALGAVGQPGRGEVEIAAEGLRGPFEEFVHGVGGGREGDHGPAVCARHREAAGPPQRRDQTGVQQGGLAGARRGDQQQRSDADALEDPLDERGRGPLPAEEPGRVLRGERRQAAVGAGGRTRGGGRAPTTLGRGGLPYQLEQLALGAQGVVALTRDVDSRPLDAGLDLAEIALAVVGPACEVGQRQSAFPAQPSQLRGKGRCGLCGDFRLVGPVGARVQVFLVPQGVPPGTGLPGP